MFLCLSHFPVTGPSAQHPQLHEGVIYSAYGFQGGLPEVHGTKVEGQGMGLAQDGPGRGQLLSHVAGKQSTKGGAGEEDSPF